MRPVVVPRENDRDLVIDVVLLAHESTQTATGPRSQRWSEIIIGRTETGAYLGAEIGKSMVPGEVDRGRYVITHDPIEIVRMLERRKKNRPGAPPTLTIIAIDALDAAAGEDPHFAATVGDVLELQHLSPSDVREAELEAPTWAGRIEIAEAVEHGSPVIRGTEVLVQVVLAELGLGRAPASVAEDLGIAVEDVFACCTYAGDVLRANRAALTLRWRWGRRSDQAPSIRPSGLPNGS